MRAHSYCPLCCPGSTKGIGTSAPSHGSSARSRASRFAGPWGGVHCAPLLTGQFDDPSYPDRSARITGRYALRYAGMNSFTLRPPTTCPSDNYMRLIYEVSMRSRKGRAAQPATWAHKCLRRMP